MIPPSPALPAQESVGSTSRRRGSLWLMKAVDLWIGLPLCTALGLVVSVRRRFFPRPARPIREDGTLVVSKFFGIGTILEATALLAAIRERYPRARLVFLTFKANEDLIRRLDLCTDVRVIRTRSPILFAVDTLRHVIWMRTRDVDAAVDLEFYSKFSTLMSVLGGARMRVGYHLNAFWRSSLLTHPVYFNYYRHVTSIFAQAGSRIDVPVLNNGLRPLPVDEGARARVQETLRRQGMEGELRLIGINVNAGELSLERRWPIERFAWVAESLLARHPDVRVLFTGAPGEAGYVRTAYDRLSEPARARAMVTAGVWTLDEFIAALGSMACFISNDSGPMHVAAAQGVPLVTLWGPSRPDSWAPPAKHHEILYENYPCSPCIHMFTTYEGMWCRHEGWCMQAIAGKPVLDAVERVLAGEAGESKPGDGAGIVPMSMPGAPPRAGLGDEEAEPRERGARPA
ncbi:MAG TPA: glycosyltransferase family 9 protein [Candidatus Udaeobacter sp.]|nr:glycosyltransferase family 9 protein [Candidatus Udaeobacter sp.]